MAVVQLAVHAKSSTLYGRSYGCTSKFFQLDGLLLFCIFMGLHSASSAINKFSESATKDSRLNQLEYKQKGRITPFLVRKQQTIH